MSYGKTIKSLLLAAAILAPASILAVLGLRAYRAESLLLRDRYRQDQEAIVRLVAGRLSEAARKALEDLEARIGAHEPDATLETRFRAAHPLARHIFLVRRGRLIYPSVTRAGHEHTRERRPGLAYLASELDVNNYVGRIREQRRQGNRLIRGERAEFAGRLKVARRLFRQASRGTTDPSAQALLGLARVERRVGEVEKARQSYLALRRRFGGRQDREGISYALLADAGLAGMGEPAARLALLLEIHQRLLKGEYLSTEPVRHFYLRWIVEQLDEVGKGSGRAGQLRRVTSDLFASERFGTLLNLHGVPEVQQLAGTRVGSVALDRKTVLVLRRRGNTVVGYTVDEDYLGRRVAMHQREVVPADRGIQLALRRVGEVARRPGQLLFSSLLDPPLGHWTLATYSPRRDTGDPLEQRGALGRLGLVVGLILALLVGLVLTYRGVRRESELARLKSDFASNVSHELKTPLTSIRMYAEMLEEGIAGTPADRRRYQRVIIRESERLGRLIANVLDFSRVERGTRRYELQPESLAEMTREAVETFRRLAEGEKIRIEVGPGGDPLPPVTADREAAVQSILNLLSNAAKYSPGEPLIRVDLVGRDGEAGVEVRDRGIGIPPAEQKRIFDDFYRAPDSRRIGVEGTGLGLALVRRHMKACGGRVELESEQGKGSRFTLWFPRAPEERKDTEEAEHAENPDHRG